MIMAEYVMFVDPSMYTDQELGEVTDGCPEVVRCADCEYYMNEKSALKACRPGFCKPDGFCAWGVRRNHERG